MLCGYPFAFFKMSHKCFLKCELACDKLHENDLSINLVINPIPLKIYSQLFNNSARALENKARDQNEQKTAIQR